MPQRAVPNAITAATLVAGTLDILFATLVTVLRGGEPAALLRYVASGPFPSANEWGAAGATLGLLVHFTLMAAMVAAFVLAARERPALLQRPLLSGLAYGVITYVAMNLIVVPLRFPAAFPPQLLAIATQLFAHILLVGIPLALITRRYLSR